jgi:hypothetical protein
VDLLVLPGRLCDGRRGDARNIAPVSVKTSLLFLDQGGLWDPASAVPLM